MSIAGVTATWHASAGVTVARHARASMTATRHPRDAHHSGGLESPQQVCSVTVGMNFLRHFNVEIQPDERLIHLELVKR